jgi:hypothetical protein
MAAQQNKIVKKLYKMPYVQREILCYHDNGDAYCEEGHSMEELSVTLNIASLLVLTYFIGSCIIES